MNEYKITFQKENGTTGYDHFIAATEAQAKKEFCKNRSVKEENITNIAFVRADVPATKEQERKALEKIRAIVESLGSGSYVGTALEGCLEDAESNIEYDFGDSWKHRCEYSDSQLADAQKEKAAFKAELAEKEAQIEDLESRTLSCADIGMFQWLLVEKKRTTEEEVKAEAARIVETAENPKSEEFAQAVRNHRAKTEEVKALNETINRVTAAMKKMI